MKTFTRLFTMLAVAAFVAAGCVNEEPPYKEEPNPRIHKCYIVERIETA